MFKFIEIHESPNKVNKIYKLHQLISKAIIQQDIVSKLLKVYEKEYQKNDKFRRERLIQKEKDLSDTISKVETLLYPKY
mgnify:CR=1 FL=1